MELPKNITQIGESDKYCKVYAEDYVISFIKQLNIPAQDKDMAVALYGVKKEEDGVSYIFLYGACKLDFLQRESRHLSQAQQQETEKLRQKYFPEYNFMGYRILNGEMVEGFHICEQGACRYVPGYAQFYEKNDSMLAYMLDTRQGEAAPEQVNQEKYHIVRQRQEERRAKAEERGVMGMRGYGNRRGAETYGEDRDIEAANAAGNAQRAGGPDRNGTVRDMEARDVRMQRDFRQRQGGSEAPLESGGSIRKYRFAAASVFVLLCAAGLTAMNGSERMDRLRQTARQMVDEMTEQKLPDAMEAANGAAQAGTIVTEDKLSDAIQKENQTTESQTEETPTGASQEAGAQPAGNPGQGLTDAQPAENQGTANEQAGGSQSAEALQTEGTPTGASQEAGVQPAGNPGQGLTDAQPAESQGTANEQAGGSQSAEAPQTEGAQTGASQAGSAGYVIQKGDTLIAISLRQYGTEKRVSEICSLNGIENPDDIQEGQKILLP